VPKNGLWAQHRVEDVATPGRLCPLDLSWFVDFYNGGRKEASRGIRRGRAQRWPSCSSSMRGQVVIVTQTVDDFAWNRAVALVIHYARRVEFAIWRRVSPLGPLIWAMACGGPCPACQAPPRDLTFVLASASAL